MSFHIRAEGAAGTFQRGKSPATTQLRKRISKALLQIYRAYRRGKTHSTQQAWMNSRNPFNIATVCKHRQPGISFSDSSQKKCGCSPRRPAIEPRTKLFSRRGKLKEHIRASQSRRPECVWTWSLLIPSQTSKLLVFQFIRRLVCFCRGSGLTSRDRRSPEAVTL